MNPLELKLAASEKIREKSNLFERPIEPIRVTPTTTIAQLMENYTQASFQGRALGECAKIWEAMVSDSERPTILLGLSGSLIAAGMRQVIVDVVENNMVDVVVSTGAIIGQDHYQVLGGEHYQGSPHLDDVKLRDLYIDRLYDTLMCEEKYWEADQHIARFCETRAGQHLSSRQFLEALGKEGGSVKDTKSILGACVRRGVPLFVPAINDSSIGIGIAQHHHNMRSRGKDPMTISSIQDNYELTQIVDQSKATAAIYIGGGVPKNYINDSVVMTYIFGRDTGGHKYAFQLTMTGPQDGGLSGSTLSEATSWGKVSKVASHRMAYVETSIGLPLVYGYVLQKGVAQRRPRLRFVWEEDRLVTMESVLSPPLLRGDESFPD